MIMLKKLFLVIPILFLFVMGLGSVSAESLIPDWIQNTALWYGQGTITDQEYLESIKYLINNKIIFLDEEEKRDAIDPTIASDNVVVTKPRINQCSILYQAYKNIGASQFFAKYDHINYIKTCVKLYKDPVWQYEGEDRVNKLNERFVELNQPVKEERLKLSYTPRVEVISKIDAGQGKYNVKFNACAGDERIDKAKILVKSEIEAVQIGTSKDIPENVCRTYVVQLFANNPANIQITILEQVYEE